MNYQIDAQQLSGEQHLYLENFEVGLNFYVRKELQNCKTLSVLPTWQVQERSEKFCNISSNASFDIKESLMMQSKIEDYIAKKLKLDFKECSLYLDIKYKNIVADDTASNAATSGKDDGLPSFLPQHPRYSFEQIILPEDTRKRIYNALNTIKHQDLIYNHWGFAEVDAKPKSILNFFGPPGTGKTMCAHAVAKMLDKPLLALNYSEIESKYVGDAAKNLKKAFDTAVELQAVMFFDEADSFLGKRIENVSQGADQALNSLRSQMLILLEEFEGVVLFATNLVTNFDKAFESRILDHIKLDLPNKEARAEIIEKMLPRKLPMLQRPTQEELLEASELIEGFAGREIKGAILAMLLEKAGLEEESPLFTIEDIKTALSKKKEQLDKLKEEEDNRRKNKIMKRLQEKFEEDAEIEKQQQQKKNAQSNARKKRRRGKNENEQAATTEN